MTKKKRDKYIDDHGNRESRNKLHYEPSDD